MNINYRKFNRAFIIEKDFFLYCIIALYILYTFWFQYSFFEIPGLLSGLGIVMLILILPEIKQLSSFRLIYPLIFFVIFLLVLSAFNSTSMEYTFTIIKYITPCVGIFVYARKSQKKFKKMLTVITMACLLLAISIFSKGTLTYEGALQLNSLNINGASNFLTFGLTLNLFLIDVKEKKLFKNVTLIIIAIILCLAQVMCASRRGFVIMSFLVIAYIFSILKVKYRKNLFRKTLIVLSFIALVAFIFNTYSDTISSLTIFKRLSGVNTTGDIARIRYQSVAWGLFKESPLWGNGLGAVEKSVGAYSHSMYYELLACTGIIGFFTIVGYFINLFFKVNRIRVNSARKNDIEEFYAYFTMCYILSIIVSGITMVFIYESYFYIMIAVVISYIYIKRKNNIT